MRCLDTNVLVRYLTADDPRQLVAAERVIEECRISQESLFLPVLVICELIWVLTRSYGHSKAAVIETLEKVMEMDQVEIERDQVVRRSLDSYRRGRADFADYVIGEIGRAAGCRDTITFDRGLKGEAGFTVLG